MDYELANQNFYICSETDMLCWSQGKRANEPAGTRTKDGYIYVQFKNKRYAAHKIIWLLETKIWPKQLDHINRIKDDNRSENLRVCSNSQNQMNRKMKSNNISGHRGVYLKRGLWAAKITKDGKQKHLGYFKEKEEAIKAYVLARKNLFGEFA